jgi:hypothetical protein
METELELYLKGGSGKLGGRFSDPVPKMVI